MPYYLRCQRCETSVPYESGDVGFDVYCPSCGAAVRIPEFSSNDGDGSQQANRSEMHSDAEPFSERGEAGDARVFSPRGTVELLNTAVKSVACVCGNEVDVPIQEIGAAVYCDSCGLEVPTVPAIRRQNELTDALPMGRDSPVVHVSTAVDTNSRSRRTLSIVVPTAILASTIGYQIWRNGADVTKHFLGHVTGAVTSRSPNDSPAGTGKVVDITIEQIARLPESSDPFLALNRTRIWFERIQMLDKLDPRLEMLKRAKDEILETRASDMLMLADQLPHDEELDLESALRLGERWDFVLLQAGLSEDDHRRVRLRKIITELDAALRPITIEQISSLLDSADPTHALAELRLLSQILVTRQVPGDDERVIKLKEVVAALKARKESRIDTEPKILEQLLATFSRIDEVLLNRDFRTAAMKLNEVENLIAQHPEELAEYGPRASSLKALVRESRKMRTDIAPIDRFLKSAKHAVREGDVTRAIEAEAMGRYLARSTLMDKQDELRLRVEVAELASAIRLARGHRAVDDAIRFQALEDAVGRNAEVRRAYSLLPGAAEGQVRPALGKIKQWKEEAIQQSGKQSVSSNEHSRYIETRDQYEANMAHLAAGNVHDFVLGAVKTYKSWRPSDESGKQRIATVALAAVDAQLTHLRQMGNAESEDLKAIGQLLRAASVWRDKQRWQGLRRQLKQLQFQNSDEET